MKYVGPTAGLSIPEIGIDEVKRGEEFEAPEWFAKEKTTKEAAWWKLVKGKKAAEKGDEQ